MPDKKGRFTAKEKAFVANMARTDDPVYSAEKAGYAVPKVQGYQLKANAALADSIREKARERLRGEGAQVGVETLISIAKDPKQPAGARVSAGAHLTKLSGIAVDDATNGKELHEMNSAELAAYRQQLEKQQAFIDRLASDQAQDITPPASAFD